jgi:F-type H+-transporting ATPase subunit b
MRVKLIALCLLAAFLASVSPVRAAEEGGKEGAPKFTGTVKGPDGKEKEEKYDFSNPEDRKRLEHDMVHMEELFRDNPPEIIPKKFDLGIWSIVVFLVLLGVLTKFAWKPMIEGLHKREENIRGALEQAERTRQEAMELQSRLDAKMKVAGTDIAHLMDEARREALGLKDKFLVDAKAEIQQERDRLRREIETAKDQALAEIWQQSVALAAMISTKVVRRSMTEQDHRRLLDESLAELKQAGANFGKRHA